MPFCDAGWFLFMLSRSILTATVLIESMGWEMRVMGGLRKSRYRLSSKDITEMSEGMLSPCSEIAFIAPSNMVLDSANIAVKLCPDSRASLCLDVAVLHCEIVAAYMFMA